MICPSWGHLQACLSAIVNHVLVVLVWDHLQQVVHPVWGKRKVSFTDSRHLWLAVVLLQQGNFRLKATFGIPSHRLELFV